MTLISRALFTVLGAVVADNAGDEDVLSLIQTRAFILHEKQVPGLDSASEDEFYAAQESFLLHDQQASTELCNETLVGDGVTYRGCQSETRYGRTCQKWTMQTPHTHTKTAAAYPNTGLGNHNYCRNPDAEPSIWCFILDGPTRWELCDPLSAQDAAIAADQQILQSTTTSTTTLVPDTCDGYQCPAGYILQADASHITCVGECSVKGCCEWLPACTASRHISLENSIVETNNLGGKGPIKGDDEGIIIHNIFPGLGSNISIRISASATYKPYNTAQNGKYGDFIQVNIKTGTDADITFTFIDPTTMQPMEVPEFIMTWFDLDEMKNGFSRETLTFKGPNLPNHTFTTNTTDVAEYDNADGVKFFESRSFGNLADNPTCPLSMTQLQKDRSVGVLFPRLSTFTVNFGVDPQPPGWSKSGRNVLFAGASAVMCPTRAKCSTFECPAGYESKAGSLAHTCQGEECTIDVDLTTCCHVSCDQSTFSFNQIASNNLGGQGPQEGSPTVMRFDSVRPGMDLVINAIVPPPYKPWNVARNGPRGNGLFGINIAVNTKVQLDFKFLKSGTQEAAVPFGFYWTVLDFDEQKEGNGRESITATGWEAYSLTPTTQVVVTNDEVFSSSAKGTFIDNPTDMANLTQNQSDKAVAFFYSLDNEFSINLAASMGKAGRNLYFGGSSPLVCASCDDPEHPFAHVSHT